jgi:hypothetical protein
MQPSRSLSADSSESIDASIRPYVLEGPLITPGGTPGWASQPWHYVFQVSAFQRDGTTTYPINKEGDVAWALGGNGRWRLVTVVGNGFIEEIEVGTVLDGFKFDDLTHQFAEPKADCIQRELDVGPGNYERDICAWMW